MKKSNKILAVLLALVMMLTAVPMMTAGATETEPEAPAHVHAFEKTAEVKADCKTETNGSATYTWTGLTPETAYGWYAKVTNAKNGVTKTEAQSFVTEAAPFTITATAGIGGTINNVGETTVVKGASMTYTVKADEGYKILTVLVDGQVVELIDGTYTFENVVADHSITVVFGRMSASEDSSAGSEDSTTDSDDNKDENVDNLTPQAPGAGDNSGKEEVTETTPLSPGQTGDNSNPIPYIMVLILAVVAGCATLFIKKKKTNE